MHKVIYTKLSVQDLKRLDVGFRNRIVKKIYFYSCQKNPLHFAKKLESPKIGTYRFRIGDYRIIFDVDKKGRMLILMILRIKHRKDIYNL